MARQLRLDINAAPKAFRDRLTARYKRLGLELVWGVIDHNTNRVQKDYCRVTPKRKYDPSKYRQVQESVCVSCQVTKPRAEYDRIGETNRVSPACRDCTNATERICRRCNVSRGLDEFYAHSRWTCKPCKKADKAAYQERKKK